MKNNLVNNKKKIYLRRLSKLRKDPLILGKLLKYKNLNEVHKQWILWNWTEIKGEDKLLLAHRGSGKTTSVVIVGVMWFLIFNPNAKVLIIRKTIQEATHILEAIRKHYQKEMIKELYSYLGISEDFCLVKNKESEISISTCLRITPESSITARGIENPITGAHYDRIHCDDIETLKDKLSYKERKKTYTIYKELAGNIIHKGNVVSITGTPWHSEGLLLDLIKNKLVRFKKYPIGTVFSMNDLEVKKIKKLLSIDLYHSNYLLECYQKNDYLFSKMNFKSFPKVEELVQLNKKVFAHLDAAYGGKDKNALTIIVKLNGKYFVVGYLSNEHVKVFIPFIKEKMKYFQVSHLYLETNADKGFLKDLLQADNILVQGYHEKMNKYIKINSYLYSNFSDIYFDKEQSDSSYLRQISNYSKEENEDDAPDSIASILREISLNNKWKSLKEISQRSTI